MSMIMTKNVSYTYSTKYQKIEAVKDVSVTFEEGKFYAIVGKSGSGKSTLLSLLAGLDLPTDGEVFIDNNPISKINRDRYRRETVSVIYQAFNLFPLLTALENVMYPMQLKGIKKSIAKKEAMRIIGEVGLDEKTFKQYPTMMSGGEQQRVAIARALAAKGKILLADEPTGNLDTTNSFAVVEILKNLAHESGYIVVVITHDMDVAAEADIVYEMIDGRIDGDIQIDAHDEIAYLGRDGHENIGPYQAETVEKENIEDEDEIKDEKDTETPLEGRE